MKQNIQNKNIIQEMRFNIRLNMTYITPSGTKYYRSGITIKAPKQEVIMNDSILLINNENYGAPELKKAYQGYTLKGFLIAVIIHIALIAGYMLFAYLNMAKSNDIPKNPNSPLIFVNIDEPPAIDDNYLPPVDNKDIADITKDLSSLQPVPVKKDLADDVVLKTQDELNKMNYNTGREGDSVVYFTDNIKIDDTKLDIKIKNITDKPDNDRTYKDFEVEKAPECTNLSQVKALMKFPEIAVETGIEGKVTVKVLVGTEGQVIKIGSINGPDIFYDEVKENVTKLQFTAGLQNNKPVKVWVTVPFNFRLK